MICLRVDDVVLTADHLLARITPVQRPQAITPYMGLENYFCSLEKLVNFGDFEMGLGGHEAPITDVRARVTETLNHHEKRLNQILDLCRERPRTVSQISWELFGKQEGYGVMLALSEAGAHLEYLHELGHLTIENLEVVTRELSAPPLYRARPRAAAWAPGPRDRRSPRPGQES